MAMRTGPADERGGGGDVPAEGHRRESRAGRPGGQPGPTGTRVDDETERTDLDMDEPFEGFGVPPWRSGDPDSDEAEAALRGRPRSAKTGPRSGESRVGPADPTGEDVR